MRQEISSEQEGSETETEQKFVYTYYDENGRAVQSTTAEYEEENGELEVLLTVQNGGEEDRLLFRNAGSSELRVNARLGGQQYAFTVQILTNTNGNAYYSYEFSDHHGNFDRFDDDDGDDENDENDDDDDDDENEENDEDDWCEEPFLSLANKRMAGGRKILTGAWIVPKIEKPLHIACLLLK